MFIFTVGSKTYELALLPSQTSDDKRSLKCNPKSSCTWISDCFITKRQSEVYEYNLKPIRITSSHSKAKYRQDRGLSL